MKTSTVLKNRAVPDPDKILVLVQVWRSRSGNFQLDLGNKA